MISRPRRDPLTATKYSGGDRELTGPREVVLQFGVIGDVPRGMSAVRMLSERADRRPRRDLQTTTRHHDDEIGIDQQKPNFITESCRRARVESMNNRKPIRSTQSLVIVVRAQPPFALLGDHRVGDGFHRLLGSDMVVRDGDSLVLLDACGAGGLHGLHGDLLDRLRLLLTGDADGAAVGGDIGALAIVVFHVWDTSAEPKDSEERDLERTSEGDAVTLAVALGVDGGGAILLLEIMLALLGGELEAGERNLMVGKGLAVAVVEVSVAVQVVLLVAAVLGEAAELDLEGRGHACGGESQGQEVVEVNHGGGW